jgi:hypothetical protein
MASEGGDARIILLSTFISCAVCRVSSLRNIFRSDYSKIDLLPTARNLIAALKHQYAGNLAWDRVHPGATGHMILAIAFLRALGFAM